MEEKRREEMVQCNFSEPLFKVSDKPRLSSTELGTTGPKYISCVSKCRKTGNFGSVKYFLSNVPVVSSIYVYLHKVKYMLITA